jgi:hypothetical protein
MFLGPHKEWSYGPLGLLPPRLGFYRLHSARAPGSRLGELLLVFYWRLQRLNLFGNSIRLQGVYATSIKKHILNCQKNLTIFLYVCFHNLSVFIKFHVRMIFFVVCKKDVKCHVKSLILAPNICIFYVGHITTRNCLWNNFVYT